MKKLVSVLVVTMMLLACVSSALATYGPKGDVGGVYHDQIEEAMYAWGVMRDRTLMPDLPWQKSAADLGTILGTGKSIKFVQHKYTDEELKAIDELIVEFDAFIRNGNLSAAKIAEYNNVALSIINFCKALNATPAEIQKELAAYMDSI